MGSEPIYSGENPVIIARDLLPQKCKFSYSSLCVRPTSFAPVIYGLFANDTRWCLCAPAGESNKDTIFKPLKFRSGLEVKNRLFRSNISGRFDHYDGHGSEARLNWETSFAEGGVGCIISSFTP